MSKKEEFKAFVKLHPELIKFVKGMIPKKDIWLYTGYTMDEIINSEKKEILYYIDVLVDGHFDISKRNISLKFRGSENQRIIDMKKRIETKSIVLSPLNN